MSALARAMTIGKPSVADINEYVRSVIRDAQKNMIEQFDMLDRKRSRFWNRDAKKRQRKRSERHRKVYAEQLLLRLEGDISKRKRAFKPRYDPVGDTRPSWSNGEAAVLPVYVLFESLKKLAGCDPDTENALEVWEWIDERNPPKVKRFDKRGRPELVAYPFAFETASWIGGIDPDVLRMAFEPFRHSEFPNILVRGATVDFRAYIDELFEQSSKFV